MENQLLKEPGLFPSEEVLQNALGGIWPVYEIFRNTVTSTEFGLTPEWHYYNDGKAWLCKVVYKKKTVCWLSIWEGFFKVSFFFTEKHLEAIAALPVEEGIREDFCRQKPLGRLLPMIFDVSREEQLDDLLTVVRFKKTLK